MTMYDIIIDALDTLNVFYCKPARNTIYAIPRKKATNIVEIQDLYETIGVHSDNGWKICVNPFGTCLDRKICSLYGLTVEWEWE